MKLISPYQIQSKRTASLAVISLLLILLFSSFNAPIKAHAAGSTISGRVYNRNTGQGLPNAVVVAGYDSFKLAAMTDSNGHYSISDVPTATHLDIISFLAGYTYLLQNRDVAAGQNLNLDFGVIVQPDPDLIPTVSGAKLSNNSVEPGQQVTFSLTAKRGSEVPLSPETMAMNPVLGREVLLKPAGGNLYTGTFTVPPNTPEGNYTWTLFTVDEACREPASFPTLTLNVTTKHTIVETGKTIPGVFYNYWVTHGGVALYGFPISDAAMEVSPTDGKTYLTQYFERNRFEYHPELGGTPYEVLLGLLGNQVTANRRNEAPFQRIAAFKDSSDRLYFDATGHSLGSGSDFKQYWQQHGGLAQFGYPISQEFQEKNADDGKTYTVQYFERARFEYHPEFKNTPYIVELGLLGKQIYKAK